MKKGWIVGGVVGALVGAAVTSGMLGVPSKRNMRRMKKCVLRNSMNAWDSAKKMFM